MSTQNSEDAKILADQLHSAAIHLLRKLRREDAASGLNAPRLSALSVVVFAGPVTLGDLAAAEQVRPPTMTRIVDALAEQRLVVKKKNADDGRSTLIQATAAGKKLFDARTRAAGSCAGDADCRVEASGSDGVGKCGGDFEKGDCGDLSTFPLCRFGFYPEIHSVAFQEGDDFSHALKCREPLCRQSRKKRVTETSSTPEAYDGVYQPNN